MGLRWPKLSRGEVIVWVFVVLCLLSTQLVDPLLRTLSPEIAVSAAYPHSYVFFTDSGQVAPGAVDPWGQPWRWKQVGSPEEGNWYTGDGLNYAFYSSGPNGRDEGTRGDDVLHNFDFIGTHAIVYSDELLLLMALLLVWFVRGPCVRAPRSPKLIADVGRAAVIASLPATLSVFAVAWAQSRPWATSLQASQPLVIPAPVAWYGSAIVLWLLVGLAIRLTRPQPAPVE